MFTHRLDAQTELRLLEPRHASAYHAMIEANRGHIEAFVRSASRVQSVETAHATLEMYLERFAAGTSLHCGLWHQERLVGEVLLFSIDMRDRSAEIGYMLAAEAQGRGLVTRACEALLAHAFDTLALHRVELRCAPENDRSRRIAERLGFVQEGRLRQCNWMHERWADLLVFALLAPEWRGSNDAP